MVIESLTSAMFPWGFESCQISVHIWKYFPEGHWQSAGLPAMSFLL
jgi:hypothetical protein